MRAVSIHAGPAVETSVDLTSCALHVGWSWSSSAADPVTCGADMLVPSKTANGEPPLNSGRVEERICPPGAATSGFSESVKSVSPAEEKSVMMPLRPVSTCWITLPTVIGATPPCASRYARSRAPSRSEIFPPGIGRRIGIGSASPVRLSTMTTAIAPARAARIAFETKVQCPRKTSRTSPPREPAASGVFASLLGSSSGPQSRRSTGVPPVVVNVPMSTSVRVRPANELGKSSPPALATGMFTTSGGASAARTDIVGVNTCVFETAATVIASGAVPGDPIVPSPN